VQKLKNTPIATKFIILPPKNTPIEVVANFAFDRSDINHRKRAEPAWYQIYPPDTKKPRRPGWPLHFLHR
jgi:hypothetical protein